MTPRPYSCAVEQYLALDVADDEVVDRLLANEAGVVALLGSGLRLGDVPPGEVAASGVQDLALLYCDLHRLPDLVPGGGAVDVVELVEVDVIRLQALEARVERAADVQRGELALVGPAFAHVAVDLGREHGLVSVGRVLREPFADDLLGAAGVDRAAVSVSGVEEVDALVVSGIHDRVGVLHAGVRPKVHRAQADTANGKAGPAEMSEVHTANLPPPP